MFITLLSLYPYLRGRLTNGGIASKQTKNNLGLNYYQVRSTKFIDRILVLISLTYIFCRIQEDAKDSFSKGLVIYRNNVTKDNINYKYFFNSNY